MVALPHSSSAPIPLTPWESSIAHHCTVAVSYLGYIYIGKDFGLKCQLGMQTIASSLKPERAWSDFGAGQILDEWGVQLRGATWYEFEQGSEHSHERVE